MLIIAEKTLAAIEAKLSEDQGGSFRQNLQRVLPHITDAYRPVDDGFRSHLGASVIGKECARQIWYGYRATKLPHFDGRMTRLFNRGHLEEGRFIALLLSIGAFIYQQDGEGKQLRFDDYEQHFGGSCDSIVFGLPDFDPNEAVLTEYKTHNQKSFLKLKKDGVRIAKFEHYVQMNLYMDKFKLLHGLYMAVNKDNDELHAEILEYDSETAKYYNERAKDIIYSKVPPNRISKSPSFFACTWCEYKITCHRQPGKTQSIDKTCRTCIHSEPSTEGNWFCNLHRRPINKTEQLTACDKYTIIDL